VRFVLIGCVLVNEISILRSADVSLVWCLYSCIGELVEEDVDAVLVDLPS